MSKGPSKAPSTPANQVYPFLPPWPQATIRRRGAQQPPAQILGGFPTNPFNDDGNNKGISPAPPIFQAEAPTQHLRLPQERTGYQMLHSAIAQLRSPIARAVFAVLEPHSSGTFTSEQRARVANQIAQEAADSEQLPNIEHQRRNTRAHVTKAIKDINLPVATVEPTINQVLEAIAHPDTAPTTQQVTTTPNTTPTDSTKRPQVTTIENYPDTLNRTQLARGIFGALKHMYVYRNDERAAEVSNDLENRINSIAASNISLNGKKKSILMELEAAIDWARTAVDKQATMELLKAVVSSETQIKF